MLFRCWFWTMISDFIMVISLIQDLFNLKKNRPDWHFVGLDGFV